MAPPVSVRPAESFRDIRRFIDLPYDLYRENPYWVPPLRQDLAHVLNRNRNAFFEHGDIQPYLAEDASGKVVGRIAAIVNGMHLKKYDDQNGFFGFFECVEQYEVAEALLSTAGAWLDQQGMAGMIGPANPSLNESAGLLVQGFDREPSIMMPYNHAFYKPYFERYGLARVMTMWAYYVHKKYVKTDKLKRGSEIVLRRNPGLTVRKLDMNRFEEETHAILQIYREAWEKNWGNVPMTDAEFARLAKDLKQIADPNIVFILELNGEPVAFSISLPNLNQILKRVPDGRLFPSGLPKLLLYGKLGMIYECRTALMGTLQKYQGRGFDAILNLATIEEGPRHGYDASEMSWILDSNEVMKNALASIGGVVDKEYGMYQIRFDGSEVTAWHA
jgi:hypothetical protein